MRSGRTSRAGGRAGIERPGRPAALRIRLGGRSSARTATRPKRGDRQARRQGCRHLDRLGRRSPPD
ncbi:hypothetical protein AMJ39_08755 [candidate division TA06 bacterium DG_24]|uniref:Uncharacterized protein n=1 Tax=candidate division TA06 bacterium DG_24 TaxID=1703770 RepID=A0A0S7WPD8_UNCT6|nr:MAG: hypothetical protein AMJ39_08755 [candidate division TA06 bacterium DG_24]